MPCYKQNLPIALQNQSWYTRPSRFLTRSSDQSESPQVNQIRRSIFLSSSLLPALCLRNVGKAYPMAMPLLRVYLFCMRLYIVQQFIIFMKTLRKQAYFCQKRFFISCSIKMLLSYTKCTIFQGSQDSRLPPHSSRILRWPSPASEKFCQSCAGR